MTTPVTGPAPPTEAPGSGARRLGRSAALIAVITAGSRIVGFLRTLLLGHVAGQHITTAYLTANMIPNIVFEIVVGGALAALVVPLVAGPIARGDRAAVSRITSALLTWVLVILVPLAVLVAVFAHPIVALLAGVKVESSPAVVDVGARMLRIFAPQIPLYGVAIVLGGVLQAHRRFVWPVLAPLLSSMAVIATYAAYGAAVHTDVPHVPVYGQMILAVGTTLGVVVLSLCLIVPARGLHLAARPTLRFEAGTRRTVGGLAAVGVVTVAVQQLALAYAVYLANRGTLPATGVAPAIGGTGHGSPIYVFTLAQTIYLVPWGVLAVPVAISVYPELATAASVGDDTRYRGTLAAASRTVLLLCALGAAAMIAVARPAARLIGVVSNVPAGALATAIIAFAPGLVGFGLFALHSRALYARGENRFAALATAIGWTAVIVGSGVLAAVVPRDQRVTALAAANSAGMVVLAVALAVIIVRRTGAASLAGLPRATLAGVVAGAAAAVAGIAVRAPLPADPGVGGDVLQGMLSGFVAAVVFLAVAAAADRHDVRPLLARLLRFVGFGRAASRSGDNEDQREQ